MNAFPPRPIAAFDFDGTLTYKDSFTAFLFEKFGFLKIALISIVNPGLWLGYIRTRDRGVLKSHLIYKLMGAIPKAKLEDMIADFTTGQGQGLFRPDALETWHGYAGSTHLRVIVTASPEILVAPLGALIGADLVIGTRLGFSEDGRLRRDLDGVNCRGAEKVRRLREVFGDGLNLDAAYGDTAGDQEMIAAARHGHYRVFHGKP